MAAPSDPRAAAHAFAARPGTLTPQELTQRQSDAERVVREGSTFTVYSEGENTERAWPFDIVPRPIPLDEWRKTEGGACSAPPRAEPLHQRCLPRPPDRINGRFPAALLESSKNCLPACHGVDPVHGVWAHICGTDLVRDADGTLYGLEDNLRVPSGVS